MNLSDITIRVLIIGILAVVGAVTIELTLIELFRDGDVQTTIINTLTGLVTDVLLSGGPIVAHLLTMKANEMSKAGLVPSAPASESSN